MLVQHTNIFESRLQFKLILNLGLFFQTSAQLFTHEQCWMRVCVLKNNCANAFDSVCLFIVNNYPSQSRNKIKGLHFLSNLFTPHIFGIKELIELQK